MKKIIFRADGNSTSGLGHLYRIFALIEFLKNDFDCILVTAQDSTIGVIPKEYKTSILPDSVPPGNEAKWLSEKYPSGEYKIIIDGYHFDSLYQKKLKEANYKVIYIDDLASEHMYADLVINHSPSAATIKYSSEKYTRFALGTDFALVRPLFTEAAKHKRKIKTIDTAFVCFGGSDQFNLTTLVCNALINMAAVKKINIVVGGAFKNNEIYDLQKTNPHLDILKNLSEKDLLSVMQQSHFAIVPTSTILFEVCCVKMPVLSGYYMDNQEDAYYAFLKENAVQGVDNFKEITNSDLEKKITGLLNSGSEMMLESQSRLFDGGQKQRLIALLNTL